jgi:dTDP-4-dehydrorhamnose reductase
MYNEKNSKIKVFICGASGLLGADLCRYLKHHGIDFQGTYNSNYVPDLIKVDFKSIYDIENAMKNYDTTICINCIVERSVNICEDDWKTVQNINIDIPNRIAKVCHKLKIHLIHISTDYVFDGKNPPYLPDSPTNPLQNYGISKLISENRVFSNCNDTTVIRVSVLYTDNIKNLDDNAVTLIGKKVLNRIEQSKEDNYSVRRPNYIPDFCHFIGDMISNPRSGIFHYYNPNVVTTKYQTAEIISNFLHKPIINHIHPIDNGEQPIEDVERPLDTQLIDNKYDINKYQFTPMEECIKRCFQPLYHPPLVYDNSPTNNLFFLLDLDGTLVDTDKLHFASYNYILKKNYDIELNSIDFEYVINSCGFDHFLKKDLYLMDDVIKNIKREKKEHMLKSDEPIVLMKNVEKLINYIHKYNINHAVVTNTNNDIVNSFKKKSSILNLLTNWITREDYVNPKPNSECYELALTKFGKGETNIIGFENTIIGYNSLINVTKCVYIMTNMNCSQYNILKNKDAYLIDDYDQVFDNFTNV